MQYSAQAWNPTGAPQQRPATYNPGLGQQAYRPPPPNAVSQILSFHYFSFNRLPISVHSFVINSSTQNQHIKIKKNEYKIFFATFNHKSSYSKSSVHLYLTPID